MAKTSDAERAPVHAIVMQIQALRDEAMRIKDANRDVLTQDCPANKALYRAWNEMGLAIRELRSKSA